MGKNTKKKLEARLSEAYSSLRDLEYTGTALSEELQSAREETAALQRQHERLVGEVQRSQDELTRVGEELTGARSALSPVVEEKSRLAADLRHRDEHASKLQAQLQDAKALGDVLERRALQAETRVTDLQAQLGRERLAEVRLQVVQGQLSDALKRLRDAPPADASIATPEEGGTVAKLTAPEPSSSSSTDAEPDIPSGNAEPAALLRPVPRNDR